MPIMRFTPNTSPTIGVEIELQMIDARELALTSAIDQVLAALPDHLSDSVKPELMQCYVEINTRICRNVREVGEDLREKLKGAAIWDQGFATVEFVASALVDLEFHDGPPPVDPLQKQTEILEAIGMPQAIRMRHATPHFAHVFAGDGYSSGYYSYMWSEVMDADAFAAFEEAGDPFSPELAQKLETHILSAGGSAEAEALYTAFRGRMPGVEALLKGRGLVEG